MTSTTVFPGRYVQGEDAMRRLGEELTRYGGQGVFICDPYVHEHLMPQFEEDIRESVQVFSVEFGGECSDEEIQRLEREQGEVGGDFVVGIGGGKTLDAAKLLAGQVGLPMASVPTIASTDAACSAVAVVYTPRGEYKRLVNLPHNPDLVLVDTGIVARAPVRFLVSGMGDALATWFEAESCRDNYAPNMTGDLGSMSAYALARLCYETLLDSGPSAIRACQEGVVTPTLERIVEANTLLSGLGFESGGLAAAHSIHNGLTVLERTHGHYHGEKVAFGTLASLFLTDRPRAVVDEAYAFCMQVGLPTTLDGVGLQGVSDQDLARVAEAACAEGETIYNEAVPVSPRAVLAALKAADAEGRARAGAS